jgi:hypothetical protein
LAGFSEHIKLKASMLLVTYSLYDLGAKHK